MQCKDLLDFTSTLATSLGVVVAICLYVIPAIRKGIKNNKISTFRIYQSLLVLKKYLTEYRIYNPAKYIINNGQEHYAYSLKDVKIELCINPSYEINEISKNIQYQNREMSMELIKVIINMKKVFSGFPVVKEEWDDLEMEMDEVIVLIGKKVTS